jgi:ADP-dependent phosphofructokinase/glucokinase
VTDHLVLGLGGTVDFEIEWDSAVFERLIEAYGIGPDDLSLTVPVTDERSLVVTVLAFLERGVGGERFVASSDIVREFAARFRTRITLGGTGVRAGIAMESLGVPSVQHLVSIDDNVRRLLPASTTWISSAEEDSLDPHLIVQFAAGTRVASGAIDITAPHSNRVILANDPPNREMRLSADLAAALRGARAFLISGFNTMTDPALLESRLDELTTAMAELPRGALVFYEDAGFYEPDFSARVRQRLLGRIDVYSLNEDELQGYLGTELDLLDPDAMATALVSARAIIPAPILVVHTRFWALALGAGAESYRSALMGAVTMAATRYRVGDGHAADDYADTSRLPAHDRGREFAAAIEERFPGGAVCVPAYAPATTAPTTIGLGDSFVGGFLAAWSVSGGAADE